LTRVGGTRAVLTAIDREVNLSGVGIDLPLSKLHADLASDAFGPSNLGRCRGYRHRPCRSSGRSLHCRRADELGQARLPLRSTGSSIANPVRPFLMSAETE